MDPEVAYMRHVRDDMIGSNEVGRLLVGGWNAFYYSWSRLVAECIANSKQLRATFGILLLPLIAAVHSTAFVYTTIEPLSRELASVTTSLLAAILSTSSYILLPLFIVRTIYKKYLV